MMAYARQFRRSEHSESLQISTKENVKRIKNPRIEMPLRDLYDQRVLFLFDEVKKIHIVLLDENIGQSMRVP
jgi:hypothetical protein